MHTWTDAINVNMVCNNTAYLNMVCNDLHTTTTGGGVVNILCMMRSLSNVVIATSFPILSTENLKYSQYSLSITDVVIATSFPILWIDASSSIRAGANVWEQWIRKSNL